MDFNKYQNKSRKTWYPNPTQGFVQAVLGLVGESGEIAEKVKKQLRGDGEVSPEDMKKELGDVLYYIARLADYYELNLEQIAISNIKKLTDRNKRGVIKGSGDDR